eukprot:CAMPEP_0206269822 /NCGR_PEP_ID=MMETSP0047_2-20121206/32517_1 /ASSEMBLY_ACC=CAM_ASM_000192 /TAXON_ID=195065 /ORGANISM="Chroomonas mesostigmatica_cf, Strain CCMP1168" /LENGTH=309 /DNA_ID=CAMNT_0053698377 /DNA_START=77 /DNA_END=1003 /DNA_ORIENTATION=+
MGGVVSSIFGKKKDKKLPVVPRTNSEKSAGSEGKESLDNVVREKCKNESVRKRMSGKLLVDTSEEAPAPQRSSSSFKRQFPSSGDASGKSGDEESLKRATSAFNFAFKEAEKKRLQEELHAKKGGGKLPSPAKNKWGNVARKIDAVKAIDTGEPPPDIIMPDESTLVEVPEKQVRQMRQEFESISAPKVSMTFAQLQKFQARMIRRQGTALFKNMPMTAMAALSKREKKFTEKEIREYARKTAEQVFTQLGQWDTFNGASYNGSTITFELYLAVALRCKVATQTQMRAIYNTSLVKGILREPQHFHEFT